MFSVSTSVGAEEVSGGQKGKGEMPSQWWLSKMQAQYTRFVASFTHISRLTFFLKLAFVLVLVHRL